MCLRLLTVRSHTIGKMLPADNPSGSLVASIISLAGIPAKIESPGGTSESEGHQFDEAHVVNGRRFCGREKADTGSGKEGGMASQPIIATAHERQPVLRGHAVAGENRVRLTVEGVSATDPAVGFVARVRHGLIYRTAVLAGTGVLTVVCALAAFACSGGGGDFGHPKITVERIGNDMAGRRTGEGLDGWYFEEDESRDIGILDTEYSGNTATIVIHMKTVSVASGRFTGKLRLHYEWVAFNDWTLVGVENLDFKRRP